MDGKLNQKYAQKAIEEYSKLDQWSYDSDDTKMHLEDELEKFQEKAAEESTRENSMVGDFFDQGISCGAGKTDLEENQLDTQFCYMKFNDALFERFQELIPKKAENLELLMDLVRIHTENMYVFDLPEMREHYISA